MKKEFLVIILTDANTNEIDIYIAPKDMNLPESFDVNDIPEEFKYVCTCYNVEGVENYDVEYELNYDTEKFELV